MGVGPDITGAVGLTSKTLWFLLIMIIAENTLLYPDIKVDLVELASQLIDQFWK